METERKSMVQIRREVAEKLTTQLQNQANVDPSEKERNMELQM